MYGLIVKCNVSTLILFTNHCVDTIVALLPEPNWAENVTDEPGKIIVALAIMLLVALQKVELINKSMLSNNFVI